MRILGILVLVMAACGAQGQQRITVPDTVFAAVVAEDTVVLATPPEIFRASPTTVSPTAAVFVGAVFPGWGQLATDNHWRAVAAFAFETWFLSRAIMYERKGLRYKRRLSDLSDEDANGLYELYSKEYFELMRDNAWWAGGALFIIALDAYVGAHLHRFDEDRVPVPDGWDPAEVPQPIELQDPAPGGVAVLRWNLNF